MIHGIGTDLVQLRRMREALERHGERFALRILAASEVEGWRAPRDPARFLAKRFAAKEAFLKAAGTGLAGPFALCEIEAVRLESGAPEYRFSGGSAQWMDERHLRALLSLSHDVGMALAFCILETET